MAHIEDRWHRIDAVGHKVRSDRYGRGRRWRARWNEDNGRERSQSFDRRVDADRHVKAVEGDKLRGNYIDPHAGRVPFTSYATDWLAAQTFDERSREIVERHFRLHAFPHIGHRDLAAIRPSHLQAMIGALNRDLATSYVRAVFAYVSAVLAAAVDDGRLGKNPARVASIKLPKSDERKVVPWPRSQVEAVRKALPDRYQLIGTLAAGCGLRQGETFGLALEDVNFLRRVVHVRRQVKVLGCSYVFAPPKGGKSRDVPLPESVALALSAHIAALPPRDVTLPWQEHGGSPVTVRLLVTTGGGEHLTAKHFNRWWRRSLKLVGVPAGPENGLHALRHWYASVLLDAGESIKAVSEYLGHSSTAFTLRTYTHLMPTSEGRTRRAVDQAFAPDDATADGPSTAQGRDV